MKETSIITADQVAIHAQKEVAKKKVLLGKLKPYPGQKVYQCNLLTSIISPAEFDEQVAEVLKDGSSKVIKNIKVKDGHLYCCAINTENAMKHFARMINKYVKK